ncbi:MAG: pentapeptide repeat-containing protein [Gammaproteobacteria bacterium]
MTEPSEERVAEVWFVRRGGRAAGSASTARIRHHVLVGRLRLSDEVSLDGAHWRPIAAVPQVIPLRLRRDREADVRAAAEHALRDRHRALAAIALSLAVLVGCVALTLRLGEATTAPAGASCDAPPTPGVIWSNCRLDGADWPSASLGGANLSNVSLINARLNDAELAGADLAYANLAGAELSYARLRGARLLGANLRGADLTNADLADADLSHADLTGARTGAAQWAGARLDGAIWLDGRRCAQGSRGECL